MTGHALITGGSTGIGKAIASVLVKDGRSVPIASRSERKLREAAAELNAQGPGQAHGRLQVQDLAEAASFLLRQPRRIKFENIGLYSASWSPDG